MNQSIKWVLAIFALPMVLMGSLACEESEPADEETTPDPKPTDSDQVVVNYECIPDTPVDEAACGPYPEGGDNWDLGAVVPRTTFRAYYDRDCDGTVEETEMDLYRDVYCQKDKIKSLALVVGSYCGEETGEA